MATPAAPAGGENPYGLMAALEQGGIIAWSVFIILVGMSIFTFYIMFTKLFEQQIILNQGKKVRQDFWQAGSLREGAAKLDKNSAYRQIVDDGILALEQHDKLTDPIDQHEWMLNSLARSQASIQSRLARGLAFLASVGSTAPFIGLFGTVIGIYRALIKIGLAGQASIDAVAGPVGEALIMTALGLVVAVPAVLGYNWLIRRNKSIAESLGAFSNDLHGYMMSGGTVKPALAGRGGGSGSAPAGTGGTVRTASTGGPGSSLGGTTSTGGVGSTGPGAASPGGTTATGGPLGTSSAGPKKV
jgi:biopolymer transport protein ExbB